MLICTRFLVNLGKSSQSLLVHKVGYNQLHGFNSWSRLLSTVSPDEVSFYNNAGFDWWTGVSMKPLRALNQLRVPLIRDSLTGGRKLNTSRPLEGYRCVDAGCGGGLLCEPLARLGASVIGIDPAQSSIYAAEEHRDFFSSNLADNLHYQNVSIEEFVANDENHQKFDAVIASEVLEHVHDLDMFIKCCEQLIKPGGNLIITTINQTFLAYIVDILLAEKVFDLVPRGTHQYELFISPTSLQKLVEHNNFTVRSIQGMIYNPLSSRWSWSKCTANNYAMVTVKNEKVEVP